MIKVLFFFCFVFATNVFAVPIDPAPDHIGVYFDPGATTTSYESSPHIPFNAYLIITNPTAATVLGVELTFHCVVPSGFENSYSRIETSRPIHALDFGVSENPSYGDYAMAMDPIPQSSAVAIVTWEFILTDDFPMDIFLGPAVNESIVDGLPAYASGDSLVPLGLSSGNVNVPVAKINGGLSEVPMPGLQDLVVLEQCQPNPFNPRTEIRYSMAQEGPVKLWVHDVSGRTVRVLVDGEIVGPGWHEVTWDGMDSAGGEVASGVYLYRIEALGVSESKRMVLVR
jgi:FlgD Ig-like domain